MEYSGTTQALDLNNTAQASTTIDLSLAHSIASGYGDITLAVRECMLFTVCKSIGEMQTKAAQAVMHVTRDVTYLLDHGVDEPATPFVANACSFFFSTTSFVITAQSTTSSTLTNMSDNNQKEQEFKIQPHPATDNGEFDIIVLDAMSTCNKRASMKEPESSIAIRCYPHAGMLSIQRPPC